MAQPVPAIVDAEGDGNLTSPQIKLHRSQEVSLASFIVVQERRDGCEFCPEFVEDEATYSTTITVLKTLFEMESLTFYWAT